MWWLLKQWVYKIVICKALESSRWFFIWHFCDVGKCWVHIVEVVAVMNYKCTPMLFVWTRCKEIEMIIQWASQGDCTDSCISYTWPQRRTYLLYSFSKGWDGIEADKVRLLLLFK